jgi:hypothetical protein
MEIESDKLLLNAIKDGVREGIKTKMQSSYNNPIDKMITDAITRHDGELRKMLDESLLACMSDTAFRSEIATAVRHTLAKTLVARFGGELEKQVNVLKSDPTTRARITLAIEAIVKERSAVTA